MEWTVLLLSVFLAPCLSAPAPPKQQDMLLKELRAECPTDMVPGEKYKALQENHETCQGEVRLMKDGFHKCKDKLVAAYKNAAAQELQPQPRPLKPTGEKLEHCFVPEMDCYTGYGHYYRGTARVTENGWPCQMWEVQSPKRHTRTPANYPHDDLAGNNYCRNPDWGNRPWCYVAEPSPAPRWEYCAVPRCPTA